MHPPMGHAPHHYHHLRFYIMVITLVIGGIFVLLYMNGSDGFSLTSAMIGVVGNDSNRVPVQADSYINYEEIEEKESAEAFTKSLRRSSKEVNLLLAFDHIPYVHQEASAKEIVLGFTDLTTDITVNNDKLELNNMESVVLKIEDFSGEIDFNNDFFSLDGTAKTLVVNDITLSSKGEIQIAFDDLSYQFLSLDDVELEALEMPRGNGEVTVADKLVYALEQDQLTMHYFNGLVTIDQNADVLFDLQGVVRGISISGALLDFNIQ